ncbi:MAG: hypothetical protein JOZ05_07065 [Acetobacteraceae bacterium]|nr:hypothetical protein [Acetobacteraceae bacterium]
MALLDDLTKGATPGTVAIGVGAALLAPLLAPALSSVLRPAVKAVVRTGITVYRSAMEPISAAVGNLVAEAQMELATASAAPATEATGSTQTEDARPPRGHKRRGGDQ